MEGEADVFDLSCFPCRFQKCKNTQIDHFVPEFRVKEEEHIVINAISAESFELNIKDFVHIIPATDKPRRKFVGYFHPVPVSVCECFSQHDFALSVAIGIAGIEVIDPSVDSTPNLPDSL